MKLLLITLIITTTVIYYFYAVYPEEQVKLKECYKYTINKDFPIWHRSVCNGTNQNH